MRGDSGIINDLLLYRVAGFGFAVGVQLVTGPEEAARDQVEIAVIGHGCIVVADGRGEDARFAFVGVYPRDDEIIGALRFARLVLDDLSSAGERAGGVENLNVVVVLFANRRPIRQPFADGMSLVRKRDGDRLLRAVAAGLEAEVFIPMAVVRVRRHGLPEIAKAVAVHGAMQVHAGNAVLMGLEHALDDFLISDVGSTFVVDDHIVALRVIGMAVDRKCGMGVTIWNVNDIHDDVRPRLNTVLEDHLLIGVIMAAAADYQEGLERLGGFLRGNHRGNRQRENDNQQAIIHEWGNDLHGCD